VWLKVMPGLRLDLDPGLENGSTIEFWQLGSRTTFSVKEALSELD
jgi:hypothetical protein